MQPTTKKAQDLIDFCKTYQISASDTLLKTLVEPSVVYERLHRILTHYQFSTLNDDEELTTIDTNIHSLFSPYLFKDNASYSFPHAYFFSYCLDTLTAKKKDYFKTLTYCQRMKVLQLAVLIGNSDLVDLLLSLESSQHGETLTPNQQLLNFAARAGNPDILKTILSYSNTDNQLFVLPTELTLKLAARSGNIDSVKLLLSLTNNKNEPLLHVSNRVYKFAARSGNLALFKLFMPEDKRCANEDTLNAAIMSGNLKLVQHIITHWHHKKVFDTVALELAINSGKMPLVKSLLSLKNQLGQSLFKLEKMHISAATGSGNLDMVKFVLGSVKPSDMYDLFSCAAAQGHHSIFQYLMKKYKKQFSKSMTTFMLYMLLEYAITAGNVDIVKDLLALTDSAGNVLLKPRLENLCFAFESGNQALVSYLLSCNPELRKNLYTFNADLQIAAAQSGKLVLMKYIVTAANTRYKLLPSPDVKALIKAIEKNHIDMCLYLFTLINDNTFSYDAILKEAIIHDRVILIQHILSLTQKNQLPLLAIDKELWQLAIRNDSLNTIQYFFSTLTTENYIQLDIFDMLKTAIAHRSNYLIIYLLSLISSHDTALTPHVHAGNKLVIPDLTYIDSEISNYIKFIRSASCSEKNGYFNLENKNLPHMSNSDAKPKSTANESTLRNDPISPTLASSISKYSSLGYNIRHNGFLTEVKTLEKSKYKAVPREKKIMAFNQIIAATRKTLESYRNICSEINWRKKTKDSKAIKIRHFGAHYKKLGEILWANQVDSALDKASLEKLVAQLILFFKDKIGPWSTGSKNASKLYSSKPSIQALLMKNLLTIPLFHRKKVGHMLSLITRTELTHGIKYLLNLRKNNFGGCDINGLIRFFENECKRFAGLKKPASDEKQPILPLLAGALRDDPISPTLAGIINNSSELGFAFRHSGFLTKVKILEKNEYNAASQKTKAMALEQMKTAVLRTLKDYNHIWNPPPGHKKNRASYNALMMTRLHNVSLEELVAQLMLFFKDKPGKWNAGQKDASKRHYVKNKGPSIKTLLMKNLLTIPLFHRQNIGDTLTLITRTELTHGIEYWLNLKKNNFGGCDINGLIRFFENECKRFAGFDKAAIDEKQSASPSL